jgi:phosphoserine phosphatase RsbU/P
MPITQEHPTPSRRMARDQAIRPSIRIVAGPSAGRIYPIERRITLIGRWTGCDVVLQPLTVSKRHAVIERSSAGYFLCDVASRAGTLVDARRIKGPFRLHDGACFQVCDFHFAFTDGVEDSEANDPESTVAATIDAWDLSQDRPTVSPELMLRVLMDIGRDLGRALQADEVLDRALDSLFRIFPQAGRGTVFLRAESDGTPLPRVMRSRSGRAMLAPTCRAILDLVIGGRRAILSSDSSLDFPDSPSIAYHAIRSLISAPLLDSTGHPLGAIQLDSKEADGRFVAGDLEVLVAVAGLIGIAVENAQMHRSAIREAERDHELHLARRVLMDLLPKHPCEPDGYESYSYYEPAKQVGGDYLGAFPIASTDDSAGGPARRWALAVGDVAGHGMPAALFLARLSAEVRLVLRGEVDPAGCLAWLNEQLMAANDDLFVTFSLATLDSRTHRFEAAGAGHLAPMIRRGGGGPLERVGQAETGLPLGVKGSGQYRSAVASIEPGDVVILCTDGIYEAMNPGGKCLGLPALERIILAAPAGARGVGEAILEAVRDHLGECPQADDMTILCLGRPARQPIPQPLSASDPNPGARP